jgi:hypothetical protein
MFCVLFLPMIAADGLGVKLQNNDHFSVRKESGIDSRLSSSFKLRAVTAVMHESELHYILRRASLEGRQSFSLFLEHIRE